MFVVIEEYLADHTEIDTELVNHYEWITRHYEAGDFVAAGHCPPRTAGVIIARGMPRGKLDAILATDPFVLRKLARYDVIEFEALRTVPELAKYADRLAATGGQ